MAKVRYGSLHNNSIFIREATNQDSNAIIELIFNIWIGEHHFAVKKEDFPDLHDIEQYYQTVDGLFLVATIDNKIVATIACNKLKDKQFVLKRMFVKKDCRRFGIAQLLLDQLFNEIVYTKNISDITFYLSTKEKEAIAAKHFYLKNGFEIINKEDIPKNFPFFYEDDLFMRKMDFSSPKKY